jgi:hypothetical protein
MTNLARSVLTATLAEAGISDRKCAEEVRGRASRDGSGGSAGCAGCCRQRCEGYKTTGMSQTEIKLGEDGGSALVAAHRH